MKAFDMDIKDSYKLFIASSWVNKKVMSHIYPENFMKSTRLRDQDFLSKKTKCVLLTIVGSDINEAIKTTLNFFI